MQDRQNAIYEYIKDRGDVTIVELVENGVVYCDLTASELFDIKEQKLPWNEAKKLENN